MIGGAAAEVYFPFTCSSELYREYFRHKIQSKNPKSFFLRAVEKQIALIHFERGMKEGGCILFIARIDIKTEGGCSNVRESNINE